MEQELKNLEKLAPINVAPLEKVTVLNLVEEVCSSPSRVTDYLLSLLVKILSACLGVKFEKFWANLDQSDVFLE